MQNNDVDRSRRGLVLVVDGHAGVRALTQRMLEGMQYTAVTAGCSERALELLDARHAEIDVLLTELSGAKLNGVELAAQALRRHRHLRVIYVSAATPSGAERSAIAAAGGRFILKPFTVEQLASAMAAAERGASAGLPSLPTPPAARPAGQV